ncbi:MAG: glutamate racemase [Gammaproteobacteria bacterium]
MKPDAPIGVFDSGVGGLTVLRALREHLPCENLLYLGDTARVPYGTRSAVSVRRYARQATGLLVDRGIKYLVVACNTASAVAIDDLEDNYAPLPVTGVVEPGALAGCRASYNGHIAVVATESTARGGAYERAIADHCPGTFVTVAACPLLVALAEEGWTDGSVVEAVVDSYLKPLFANHEKPDCLILGCTHFPILADTIGRVAGHDVTLVDSAETTAVFVDEELQRRGLNRSSDSPGSTRFLATDSPRRFAKVGGVFLGESLSEQDVELVDL